MRLKDEPGSTEPTAIGRNNVGRGTDDRPNCSLCDVAKAELAKVRQMYQFELDVVNIQDPGQEHWKRKYVYWIPALHIDGEEVAKGRWDRQTVIQALDSWRKNI
ncbi:hypothetical protein EDB89DRAFT_1900328 [Lactarius sanguifluus]|nr:hypothetical protein EDB89DRAFT_1900328 [Lactarius sanguifluus]